MGGSNDTASGMAIASLVLGVINLITCCIPCCGVPLSLIGLGLGIGGINSPQKTLAIIGIVLNSVALLMALVNGAYGAYLGATGQNPWLKHFQTANP